MRLFVAAPLDKEMCRALYRDLSACREKIRGITWVKPEAMHITFAFLGEIPDESTAGVKNALHRAGPLPAPFDLDFSGFGRFPTRGPARVLFCRVQRGAEGLETLHGLCTSVLKDMLPPGGKRPFKPHLTVGRVRRDGRQRNILNEAPAGSYSSRVNRIVLYRSVLRKTGPEYHEELVKFLAVNP